MEITPRTWLVPNNFSGRTMGLGKPEILRTAVENEAAAGGTAAAGGCSGPGCRELGGAVVVQFPHRIPGLHQKAENMKPEKLWEGPKMSFIPFG